MRTILVDDMLLDLQLLELKCADLPDFEIIGKFTNPQEAIAFAQEHVVDVALLDIDMPGMNGMELARMLRAIRPGIIIVFVTAHPKFAVDALKMKADYIIFKPYDQEDIEDVLERARLLLQRQKKRFYFHTFGVFDMFIDGKPVRFRSAKAKELMALCVFCEGRPVSIHRMVECLWGEDATATPENTGYRRTIKELSDTLKAYGAEALLVRERGSLRIQLELADSDLQDFMNGKKETLCSFQGAYMQQYSWAEEGIYALQERKEMMLSNKEQDK